jgi:hypothetical protein
MFLKDGEAYRSEESYKMYEKFDDRGQDEPTAKIMVIIRPGNPEWLTVLLGLFLFLTVPSTWAAHDLSDLKSKAEEGDANSQVRLGLF